MFIEKLRKNLILAGLLLTCSCAGTSIESNKDSNYNADIHRLAVVTNYGNAADIFIEKFDDELLKKLKSCHVNATIASGPLEQATAIADKSNKHYDALLTMGLDSNTIGFGKAAYNYTFVLRNAEHKIVWKSLVTYNFHGTLFGADKGQKLAGEIVDRMHQDGIFKSCSDDNL